MELNLETVQKTVLSAKMIQSAEILQMSSQELEEFLKKAEAENPVIDFLEYSGEELAAQNPEKGKPEAEYDDYPEEAASSYSREPHNEDEVKISWENYVTEEQTLAGYLISQLGTLKISKEDFQILNYMIGSLDQRGYLKEKTEDISELFRISGEKTEGLIKLLQSFEPAGVGARNLPECLRIQLEREKVEDPVIYRLAEDYLEDIGKNRIRYIARELNIPEEEAAGKVSVIRNLNPVPGNGFCTGERIRYIIPDVMVRTENGIEVFLNNACCPGISINPYYLRLQKESEGNEIKNFLEGKIKQAKWVKQCILNRNLTLLKVAEAIAGRQESFFLSGPGNVKPMTLSDIAGDIGMHPSTVSRTINEKYLECSFGIFPLKYFFKQKIAGETSSISPDKVKEIIAAIIDGEDKKKPFSDNRIAELLHEKGIEIARRTVTKYREEMLINNASYRKCF